MIRSARINSKSHLVLRRLSRCTMATNDSDCGWAIGIETHHTRTHTHYEESVSIMKPWARMDLILAHNSWLSELIVRIECLRSHWGLKYRRPLFIALKMERNREAHLAHGRLWIHVTIRSECWNLNYAIRITKTNWQTVSISIDAIWMSGVCHLSIELRHIDRCIVELMNCDSAAV